MITSSFCAAARKFVGTALAAMVLGIVPAAPFPARAQGTQPAAAAPESLFVRVGKSLLVESTLPIERVSVGFGEIAEAAAVTEREVLLNGRAAGETSLIVWQLGGGKLLFDVTVGASNLAANARVDATTGSRSSTPITPMLYSRWRWNRRESTTDLVFSLTSPCRNTYTC